MLEYFTVTKKNVLDEYLLAWGNDYSIKFEKTS